MKKSASITTLFIDIGGVLLTNGWDRQSRMLASQKFNLDFEDMESRHHLTSDTFEIGKLTLENYLNRVVFYRKRMFTREDFQKFMFDQSKPFPQMINLVLKLKILHSLKIAVVSNESKELNEYRIKKFKLGEFVDFFISSSIVHLRKPDEDIFRLALEIAQVPAERVVYIENTPMFVEVAQGLGIQSILHTDYESTYVKLSDLKVNR
ncbi:HAD-IA family hydrolase [Parachlamydia acanthamoebae]|uniref:HAD-IA family hydrolase n=1 Tax=Parachlamydia acanthamoebae TaxID=83552 RepID=UPI000750A901|nr:HAD-IA family hydrolase [Parachlamydia acanthamoebae]